MDCLVLQIEADTYYNHGKKNVVHFIQFTRKSISLSHNSVLVRVMLSEALLDPPSLMDGGRGWGRIW